MRLFFAVGLEPEAAREVAALQYALGKRASDRGLRWVGADQLHYTLQFLGEVDEARLPELKAAGDAAVQGLHPFPLGLASIGAFPNELKPKVLWVGAAEGAGLLTSIAARLSRELEAIGFEPERRPFQPHLTIARVKGLSAERAASRLLESQPVEAVATSQVTSMVLMQSTLSPHGSTYSIVAEFALRELGTRN